MFFDEGRLSKLVFLPIGNYMFFFNFDFQSIEFVEIDM